MSRPKLMETTIGSSSSSIEFSNGVEIKFRPSGVNEFVEQTDLLVRQDGQESFSWFEVIDGPHEEVARDYADLYRSVRSVEELKKYPVLGQVVVEEGDDGR